MTLLHQKKVLAKISFGRIYSTVDIITPRHPCSGALAREAEHHGQENMVIYASKKFWFWENRSYGIRRYVRPPLHVSGCEMAHFNTIFVKLGIGHPCCDQLTAVTKGYPLTSVTWLHRGLRYTTHAIDDQLFVFNWSRAQVIFLKVNSVCSLLTAKI